MNWALANSNLALVKYWGKTDEVAKHPAGPSLSVTLDGLSTVAGVEWDATLAEHRIDGLPEGPSRKVRTFLDAVRRRHSIAGHAHVVLASNFPVAAGLASSASTFAALAKAAVTATGAVLADRELSDLARLGSGSACRSIFGGFVEWRPESGGSVVEPILGKSEWPIAILVAVTSERAKAVGSSEGMRRTAATSPYYDAWIECGPSDFAAARRALASRDLAALGQVAERNCVRMHAAALAADPPLVYWEPATLAVMRRVTELREAGIAAYFSIDAGPQVKVLCASEAAEAVRAALAAVPGVLRVIGSRPGDGVRSIDAPPAWADGAERLTPRQAVAS
jgi:diphosphomevalonate decarboxylase